MDTDVHADDTAPLADAHAFAEDEDLEAQLAFENLRSRREKRRRRRIVIIAVLVFLALGAAVFAFVSNAQRAADEEGALDPMSITSTVEAGTFSTSISANGATEPLSSTVVTPEVEGIIENLRVEVGMQVHEGDVLFTVRNDKLDTAVREAESQLESARRARDRALSGIDKANRDVDEAYKARLDAWERARATDDWESYDEATLNAAVSSAEDGVESAVDTYDDANAALDRAWMELSDAQAEADKRIVRAPATGIIISMSAKEGASTSGAGAGEGGGASAEPLMQIVDLSQMKVTVQVNEADISVVELGQAAEATFSALPDVVLDAKVTRIASTATGAGEGGGGSVVTYAVDLLIPEPDPALRPGMTATVTITTESVPNTLIVSTPCVGEDEGGSFVVVVDDADAGKTHRVDVEVRASNSSETAIAGALDAGDTVLLDPYAVTSSGEEELGNEGAGATDAEVLEPEPYEGEE